MKAGIFDPYLDTLGGGERYTMTVGECLVKNGWEVDVFWDDKTIKQEIQNRLGIEINRVNFIPNIFYQSAWQKYITLRKYDLIFYLSDGSIPFLFGKKNILHFQVPFINVCSKNLTKNFINRIKLKFIDQIVCNSEFTKKFIDKEYKIRSKVLYPPVDVEKFQPDKKENIILAVGRFEQTMQAKRQDVLIEVFKKMFDEGLRNWRLILVGSSLIEESENQFLTKLKNQAADYPIELLVNVSFETLKDLYGRAKIFWHSAGFGVNEEKEPYRVEHFGITTVEAMAAGCVPLVVDKGGLKEIVRRGVGKRWKTKEELQRKTFNLIKNKKLLQNYSVKVRESSLKFSKENFSKGLKDLIK